MTFVQDQIRDLRYTVYSVAEFARLIRYGQLLTWQGEPLTTPDLLTYDGATLLYDGVPLDYGLCHLEYLDEIAAILDPTEYEIVEELVEGQRVVRIQVTRPQGWPDARAGDIAVIDATRWRTTTPKLLHAGLEWELLIQMGDAA